MLTHMCLNEPFKDVCNHQTDCPLALCLIWWSTKCEDLDMSWHRTYKHSRRNSKASLFLPTQTTLFTQCYLVKYLVCSNYLCTVFAFSLHLHRLLTRRRITMNSTPHSLNPALMSLTSTLLHLKEKVQMKNSNQFIPNKRLELLSVLTVFHLLFLFQKHSCYMSSDVWLVCTVCVCLHNTFDDQYC